MSLLKGETIMLQPKRLNVINLMALVFAHYEEEARLARLVERQEDALAKSRKLKVARALWTADSISISEMDNKDELLAMLGALSISIAEHEKMIHELNDKITYEGAVRRFRTKKGNVIKS
jgi:hypothetical protein